ncbi:MAG: hypothetical protein ACRDKW_12345 [Actinomycetota bacterium]
MAQDTYHPAPGPASASGRAADHVQVLEHRVRRRTVAGAVMLAAGALVLTVVVLGGLMAGVTRAVGVETTAEVVRVTTTDGAGGWWTTDVDARFTTQSGREVTTWFFLDGRWSVGDTFDIVYLPAAPEDSAVTPGELGYMWLGTAVGAAVAVPLAVAGLLLVLLPRRKARPIRAVAAGGSRTPARMWPTGPASVRLEPVAHPDAPALAVTLLAPLPPLPAGPLDVAVLARPEQGMIVVVELPDGRLLLPKGPASALPRNTHPAPGAAAAR